MPDGIDSVEEYAWLSYLPWEQHTERHDEVWADPPVVTITPPYLEFDTPIFPEISKEKKQMLVMSSNAQDVALCPN